ncbi:MAG: hypothetical protein ABIW82_02915, partial [Dokdonella sp.]
MRELRSISFVFLARSVAGVFALLAVSAALAAGENTPTCAQPVNPAVLSPAHLLSADPVATIEDIGNVTIMDLTGEYDCLNQVPRQHIASHFLASHPDQYDFLVVFTTFEFNTGSVLAFYNPIRNDTVGIGLPLFDNSAAFSSAGRLHGFVDMAATSRYSFASNAPEYQGALNTLAHEFMHRWSAYLHFTDATGHDSGDLIGREDAHWSYFLDSDASVMLGNDWRLQEDGKFHSVDAMHRYSSLDMYAGGFAAASEVQPFTLIRNGDGGQPADVPRIGAISGGQGESITIDQVIAASGARVPSAANAQKDFSAAMILLKRPGESVSPGQLLELERFRVRFEQQFSEMTDGRGTMRIYTQSSGGAVAAPPTLHGSGSTSTPGGVAGAIAWLESRQKTDGRWEDRPATAMRDTVAVVRALSELDPGFAGNAAARAWIIAHPTANLDQRSWKLRGASLEVDAMALAAAQDSHGGFGIEPGWIASSFDTARVAAALADRSGGAAALDAALQSIGTQQNADGGFGVASGGHGKVLPTL